MDRNHRKKYNNWNNQNKNSQNKNREQNKNQNSNQNRKNFQSNQTHYEDEMARIEKEKSILELKKRIVVCSKCGQVINDITSALVDKDSGNPVHFECVMNELSKQETLGPNEKIAYIGQGRFGVLYFENPRDQRHFTIKKIIEWEERNKKSEWREEISTLYSQVN